MAIHPHVKSASKAKINTTAMILAVGVLRETQMASAMRTRHIPMAFIMNNLRLPTRSIVHHWGLVSWLSFELWGAGGYSRGEN